MGISDKQIVEKLKESNPEKRETFEEALKRGATPTQIIDAVIAQNQPAEDKESDVKEESSQVKEKQEEIKEEEKLEEVEGKKPEEVKEEEKTEEGKEKLEKPKEVEEEEKKEEEEDEGKGGKKKKTLFKKKKKEDGGKEDSKKKKPRKLALSFDYHIVCLDISDHSIEIIEVDNKKNIRSCERRILEPGIIEKGEIKDKEKLLKAINSVDLDRTKNLKVIASIPESESFIEIVEAKLKEKEDIKPIIEEKLSESLPCSLEEMKWDYVQISKEGEKKVVLVIAVAQETLKKYTELFEEAGFFPMVLDIESISLQRSLVGEKQEEAVMLVDIGAKNTVLSVFNKDGNLSMAVISYTAGDSFTKKIAEKLEINEEEAEKKKIENKEDVVPLIKEELDELIVEIDKAKEHYKSKFSDGVGKIILAGGSSLINGLDVYLRKEVKTPLEVGNPLEKIGREKKKIEDKVEKPLLFANVIGLLIRAKKDDPISGINMVSDEIKKKERKYLREQKMSVRVSVLLFVGISIFALAMLLLYYALYPHWEMRPRPHNINQSTSRTPPPPPPIQEVVPDEDDINDENGEEIDQPEGEVEVEIEEEKVKVEAGVINSDDNEED